MDGQLRWVLDLLHEYEIPYWLNSGTLLGLMREGDLLAHDRDIDLSLWDEHEPEFQKLLPLFKKAGYKVLSAGYRGLRFQYNFSQVSAAGLRNIDISLFRRCGEHAWCPEYYFRVNPANARGSRPAAGFVRSALRFCWQKLTARVSLDISVSSWPWRSFVNLGTWWIPAAYFDNITHSPDLDAFIPAEWPAYLEFRYGDWIVPRADWVFHRDDGGLVKASPGSKCKSLS